MRCNARMALIFLSGTLGDHGVVKRREFCLTSLPPALNLAGCRQNNPARSSFRWRQHGPIFTFRLWRYVAVVARYDDGGRHVVAETPSASRGRNREAVEASYRSKPSDWWPAGLGTPSAVGGQNDLRYAVFPRRLVINDKGRVQIYDTGSHRIFGIAQAQSTDQTLTFTSQDGLVRVSDLSKVME